MEIRRIRPDEWAALRTIRLRALATDPDAFHDTVDEVATRPDEHWQARAADDTAPTFVAVTPAGMVGMAVGGQAPDDRPFAALYSMWVAPEARGQGIGSAFIDTVIDWARFTTFQDIVLGATVSNTSAIALYERKGFVDTGERWDLRDSDFDLKIMIMAQPITRAE